LISNGSTGTGVPASPSIVQPNTNAHWFFKPDPVSNGVGDGHKATGMVGGHNVRQVSYKACAEDCVEDEVAHQQDPNGTT
jgi:hypothetical protein